MTEQPTLAEIETLCEAASASAEKATVPGWSYDMAAAMTATSAYLNRPLRSLAEVMAERERWRAAVARSEKP